MKDYEVAIRFTKEFYDQNKPFIEGLVKRAGKPVLIEMWDQRFFYFVLKFEFNFIDSLDKASALSTVQIDVENAERYDITYVDQTAARSGPSSSTARPPAPSSAASTAAREAAHGERERQSAHAAGMAVARPRYGSSRLSDKHVPFAEKLAEKLKDVRVDIDDREETVGKKVRDAGQGMGTIRGHHRRRRDEQRQIAGRRPRRSPSPTSRRRST